MNNKPVEISLPEWREIMEVRDVREGWGLEPDETVENFIASVYGVKFHFHSGGPGYVGDLYIVQGDSLERPMVLIRDNEGVLTLSE